MFRLLAICGLLLVQDLVGAAQPQGVRAPVVLDVVVSQGSEPIPGVSVVAAEEQLQHVASARTDADGRALLNVQPGRYRVSASRDGFQSHLAVIRIDGAAAVSLRLQLMPSDPFEFVPPGSGVVSGRVVGMNGAPVPYASVTVYDGFNPGGSGSTAADGTFRFTARALPPNSAYDKVYVSQAAHIWSDVPATVFLANQTDLPQSVPVREKQETTLELRVPTSPHYRVTVALRDELGGSLLNPSIMLFGRNRYGGARVRPDNTAVFAALPRGSVSVVATADGRNGVRLAGVVELEVVDRPLDDVVLTLVEAARIRGLVEFQGRDRQSPAGAAMQVLSRIPGRQLPPIVSIDTNGRVTQDGSFTLDGLLGTRCLWMWNVPPGWQLAAILRDGRDITDEPIDFSPGEQVDDVVLRLVLGDRAPNRPTCDPR